MTEPSSQIQKGRAALGTLAKHRCRWTGPVVSPDHNCQPPTQNNPTATQPALHLNPRLPLQYCELLLLLPHAMNCHFENRATANSAVSSTIYGTAGGRRSGLKAAKRWVSYLPLKLMSPHRKPRKVFSKMKRMMSASLAKLKYALGRDKKRASQGKHGGEAYSLEY